MVSDGTHPASPTEFASSPEIASSKIVSAEIACQGRARVYTGIVSAGISRGLASPGMAGGTGKGVGMSDRRIGAWGIVASRTAYRRSVPSYKDIAFLGGPQGS